MLGRVQGANLSPSLFWLSWQKHGCGMNIQPQKLFLQLIRLAKCCQRRSKVRAQRKEQDWKTVQVLALLLAFKEEGSVSPPQSTSIAEIVAKCQKGGSYIKCRMKKFKFLLWWRELFPMPFTPALEHILVHEDHVSKGSRGQAGKNCN